jgi:glycosyltransferase involved in cell wall biosynthesis
MKILHVTPYYEPDFEFGGVVRAVSMLCRGLAEQGHEVTVFTSTRSKKKWNKTETIGGVEVVSFRNVAKGYLPSPRLFLSAKEIVQFDLMHIAAFWTFFADHLQATARKRGLPYVVSPHGCISGLFNPFMRSTKHRALYWGNIHRHLQGATAIHYTAELERTEARPLRLKPDSFVAPNPLDWEDFDQLPLRNEAQKAWSMNADTKVILFLGRLDRRKALDVLIRGFDKAKEQLGATVLLLAGPDFGEEKSLKKLVWELNLQKEVLFTGMVDSVGRSQLLSIADLCVLTAYRGENFGIAAAEAMAAGVPVMVSDETGLAHDVKTFDVGKVVSVDEEHIAAGLVEMISGRDKSLKMGERGKQMVRERYDTAKVAQLMGRAYEDILSGERSEACAWRAGG